MVKRRNYTQEYKQKISLELLTGVALAVVSKRENISSVTLKRWKEDYLNGNNEEGDLKKEVVALRKKNIELSQLLAEALLEVDLLKKTEKFLIAEKRKDILSKAISPTSLEYRKALKR
jgi:transposase-like protein